MRKNRREYPLPHYGQIVTTRHTIKETIWDCESDICYNTAVLIALGRDDKNYMFRLYSICSKLCFISKLIFRSENGLKLIDRKSDEVICLMASPLALWRNSGSFAFS